LGAALACNVAAACTTGMPWFSFFFYGDSLVPAAGSSSRLHIVTACILDAAQLVAAASAAGGRWACVRLTERRRRTAYIYVAYIYIQADASDVINEHSRIWRVQDQRSQCTWLVKVRMYARIAVESETRFIKVIAPCCDAIESVVEVVGNPCS
jgi:hypothetical protein